MEKDNLNNLPPFYMGQKVLCLYGGVWVDRKTQILSGRTTYKNKIYQVINCYIGTGGLWYCNLIGLSDLSIDNGRDGFDCIYFRAPLQEQKFPLIKLSKIIEEELVSAN